MSIKKMNKLAPIALFVYNRPEHTERALEALMRNKLAAESELFIFADGAKTNASSETLKNIERTRTIIRQKKWCGKVSIVESDKNKGLAKSVIEGVTEIVSEYGKIIVLEDDMLSSPYFLQFMNDALTTYETSENVACISGYIYPVGQNLPETFFIKGADCWGWATWKRAWNDLEMDGIKLLKQLEDKSLTTTFDFESSFPFTKMLKEQIAGVNNSWAVRWYASAFLKNKYCLYPGVSLIQNIGTDGSGSHGGVSEKWSVNVASKPINVKQIAITENKEAKKIIVSYFQKIKTKEPILKKFVKKVYHSIFTQSPKHGWFGDYLNWKEAKNKCKGYDDASILEKVKTSLLKVKNGEAVYERDSVLFDEIPYSEPLIIALKNAAINDELHVVDFGGSLGGSYFQNRGFLSGLKKLQWSVIEQKHFVDCGKEFFEDEYLKFYYTIEEAIKNKKSTVLLLSSVIQYFEDPKDLVRKCIGYNFDYIIVDRTAFIGNSKDRITVQIVPESIYKASYPAWFFNEYNFLKNFKDTYEVINGFMSDLSGSINIDKDTKAYWKGFVLKRKK